MHPRSREVFQLATIKAAANERHPVLSAYLFYWDRDILQADDRDIIAPASKIKTGLITL